MNGLFAYSFFLEQTRCGHPSTQDACDLYALIEYSAMTRTDFDGPLTLLHSLIHAHSMFTCSFRWRIKVPFMEFFEK